MVVTARVFQFTEIAAEGSQLIFTEPTCKRLLYSFSLPSLTFSRLITIYASCAMRPCLESCPDHVVERVIASLELEDIQNLRLAGRAIAHKASRGRFRRMSESKYVDITVEALQTFTIGLQTLIVLPQLKWLYLVGLVKQSEPHSQREEVSGLLVEAFNGVAKRSRNACLESLTLRIAVVGKDGAISLPVKVIHPAARKRVWTCAVETWQTTMRALASSRLRLKKLNVFNDADMQRCSLPCNEIGLNHSERLDLTESFGTLSSLSLSICRIIDDEGAVDEFKDKACYHGEDEGEHNGIKSDHVNAGDDANPANLAKLVGLCPLLEHLELHYCRSRGQRSSSLSNYHSKRILQQLVDLKELPRLIWCTLRGISTSEEHLLQFITRTKPSHLSLQTIHLQQGTFTPIINYCTSDEGNIKTLLLDTLYERESSYQDKMVHFSETQWSLASLQGGSERLLRGQDTVKHPVTFFVSRPWFIGSPRTVAYRMRQRLEYY